jgi:hypothetical protein
MVRAALGLAASLALVAGPVRAEVETPRSKSKDDSCARFDASAREVLASTLFPAVIAIGADGKIEQQVRAGIERAAALGFRRSSEVIGYLMLRRALGDAFEGSREPTRAAVAALLRARRQPAATRIAEALRRAGRADLEPVIEAFARCGRVRSAPHGSRTPIASGDVVVGPDGLVITVGGATLGGTKLTTSVELRLRRAADESRVVIRAGESQPWRDVLLGLVEKPRGPRGLLLALDPWDQDESTGALAFGKPAQLAAGSAVRAADGLQVTVKRITPEPPFALLALKRGKEQSEVWIKPAAPAHRWLDYLVQLRSLAVRSYPKRSTVELVVEKPKASVIEAVFDRRFTLRLEGSARFPDGLRLSFLGSRTRPLKRGGNVGYLKLRLELGRRAEEREFELFEPGRGWTRTLAWGSYRILLPGDREKTTEMEFVVSK